MSEFNPNIDIATSGVNRPFILRVRGTDGAWYKQLVKSADDLRQVSGKSRKLGWKSGGSRRAEKSERVE